MLYQSADRTKHLKTCGQSEAAMDLARRRSNLDGSDYTFCQTVIRLMADDEQAPRPTYSLFWPMPRIVDKHKHADTAYQAFQAFPLQAVISHASSSIWNTLPISHAWATLRNVFKSAEAPSSSSSLLHAARSTSPDPPLTGACSLLHFED